MAAGCSGEPKPGSDQPSAAAPAVGQPSTAATVVGTAPPGSVVTLEPKTPREFAAPSDARVMDQFGQQFLPAVLVAQVGQRVEFRSSEDVLHNVRVDESTSKDPIFNVATPPFGAYTHVFDKPGYYNVSCDVHPSMRANIYVGASPYTAIADATGSFTIANVEPGDYIARTIAGPSPVDRPVTISSPRTELNLRPGP